MKKSLIFFVVLLFTLNLYAQEKGKIRVGIDGTFTFPNKGFGLGCGIDARYNLADNLNIGLKYIGALMGKDVYDNKELVAMSVTTSSISSYLVTSDYYFNKGTSMFSPFVGGGVGVFQSMNIGLSSLGTNLPSISIDFLAFEPETKFGGLIRTGFESGHFRLGLEYYLIPRTKLVDFMTLTNVGTSNNSYLNLSLGFYFGGGHWKKK